MPHRAPSSRRSALVAALCLAAVAFSLAAFAYRTAGAGQTPAPIPASFDWLSPVLISTDGGSDPYPVVASTSSGEPHLLWDHLSPEGGSEIVASRRNGLAWTLPLTLSSNYWAWRPALAAGNSGQMHGAWSQTFPGDVDNIAHVSWDGSSWSGVERVNTDPEAGRDPAVAVDSAGRLHVTWVQQRGIDESYILWSKKESPTLAWSTPYTISNLAEMRSSEAPRFAADANGNTHIAWYSSSSSSIDVYYARYSGSDWSPPERISSGNYAISWRPVIAVDSAGNTYVVWEDYGTSQLLYVKRGAGGGWSSIMPIATTTDPRHPALAVLGVDDLVVAWENWTTDAEDIYFSRGGGSSWSAPAKLVESATPSLNPSLAIDRFGKLHLAWIEVLGPGANAIYYKGERSLSLNNKLFVPVAMK